MVKSLQLLFLGQQPLDLLFILPWVGIQEMLPRPCWVELQQRRVALDLILSVLHFLYFIEVIL